MVSSSVGSIVLVKFPFSDLSSSKLRPAVALAEVDRNDWILCQVTSNPYSDPCSVEIGNSDFVSGSLQRISYARPGKLFTANISLIEKVAGKLNSSKFDEILDAVIVTIRPTQ